MERQMKFEEEQELINLKSLIEDREKENFKIYKVKLTNKVLTSRKYTNLLQETITYAE
jgi:hypothetical protein